MSKQEVNNLINKYLELIDNVYFGKEYNHNWRCKCGNLIENRKWHNIRYDKMFKCKKCKYEEIEYRYRYEVEKDGEYEYIKSFRAGEKLPNGKIVYIPFIQIKHKYCGNIYEVNANNFINTGQRCPKCCQKYENSILYKNKHIANLIYMDEHKNNVNPKLIYANSNKRFYFKCPKCNKISSNPKNLFKFSNKDNYNCEYCSDGISVPEKFMSSILNQLNLKFITQLSNLNFLWITKNIRYDFYIEKLNIIIETHGKQHYEQMIRKGVKNKVRSLKEEQINDKFKKELAIENGIEEKNYIVIDCRNSELTWLKENITKSLGNILDLSNVDWNKAWEESQNSLCVKAWELWNNGIRSTKKIGHILNLNISTICRYLKIGAELKICNYNPSIQASEIKSSKKILVFPDGKKINFPSINHLCEFLSISRSSYYRNIEQNNNKIDSNISDRLKNKMLLFDGCIVVNNNKEDEYYF